MPDIQPSPKAKSLVTAAIADLNEEMQRRQLKATAVPDTASFEIVNSEIGGGRPGDDFNSRTTPEWELRYLEGKGWTLHSEDAVQYRLTRPGKEPLSGCSATLSKSSPPILYVFSSEALPFKPNKEYKPFVTRTLLEHGGDYSAAAKALAKALARQGFGEPKRNGTGPAAVSAAPQASPSPPSTAGGENEKPASAPSSPEQSSATDRTRCRFSSTPFTQLMKAPQPQRFLIENLLYEDGIDLSFGGTGSYKSFDKLHQALCVATGLPYHGRKVIRGAALYVAGEGRAGIVKRMKAWAEKQGVPLTDELPFFLSDTSAELISEEAMNAGAAEVARIEEATGLRVVYIVFDTLSTNFGKGNENATPDVRMMFSNLRSRFPGRCCSVIQHIGHADASRPRGNSDLISSADTAYAYSKPESLQSLIECVKLKDGDPDFALRLQGEIVNVMLGDTHDSTLLFELVEEGPEVRKTCAAKANTKKLGAAQRTIINALEGLYRDANRQSGLGDTQGSRRAVLVSDWIEASRRVDKDICTDPSGHFRRDNFSRAARQLEERGLLTFLKDRKYVFLNESKDLRCV
jgi:hypothetical protein